MCEKYIENLFEDHKQKQLQHKIIDHINTLTTLKISPIQSIDKQTRIKKNSERSN